MYRYDTARLGEGTPYFLALAVLIGVFTAASPFAPMLRFIPSDFLEDVVCQLRISIVPCVLKGMVKLRNSFPVDKNFSGSSGIINHMLLPVVE